MMVRATMAWAAAVVLFASCGNTSKRLPDAAGGQGEVLVVMHKAHWEGEPGAAVRSIFEQPVDGLPQREPRFKLAHTTPENFGSLLNVHHSVLLATMGDTVKAGLTFQQDVFAKGQLVARIAADNATEWVAECQREGERAAELLEAQQRFRVGQRLARERDAAISSSLEAAFGAQLDVPGGYRVVEQRQDAAWLQRDRIVTKGGLDHNVIEGILVHRHPYTDPNTFTVEALCNQRDSVTRSLVKGPVQGSYMIVQRGFDDLDLMPSSRLVRVGEGSGYLMHGLFGMHGAKMGGPFVSLTTVHPNGKELLTVEGFVYAPQFDKREYMRELEALVFSLRWSNKPST